MMSFLKKSFLLIVLLIFSNHIVIFSVYSQDDPSNAVYSGQLNKLSKKEKLAKFFRKITNVPGCSWKTTCSYLAVGCAVSAFGLKAYHDYLTQGECPIWLEDLRWLGDIDFVN